MGRAAPSADWMPWPYWVNGPGGLGRCFMECTLWGPDVVCMKTPGAPRIHSYTMYEMLAKGVGSVNRILGWWGRWVVSEVLRGGRVGLSDTCYRKRVGIRGFFGDSFQRRQAWSGLVFENEFWGNWSVSGVDRGILGLDTRFFLSGATSGGLLCESVALCRRRRCWEIWFIGVG